MHREGNKTLADVKWGSSSEYRPRTLQHCYVSYNKVRETVRTSQWLLVDDAARDRVREGAKLTIESHKVMQALFKR